jgi:hypothetical protein
MESSVEHRGKRSLLVGSNRTSDAQRATADELDAPDLAPVPR